MSSRVSASPWNIDLAPFYLAPPPPPSPQILNLSDPPLWATPQNFGELDSLKIGEGILEANKASNIYEKEKEKEKLQQISKT